MSNITIVSNDSNAVAAWDPNSGAALPAYLTETLGELGSNIPDRQTVPSLSYEGKVWTVVKDGNKTKMQAPNADGDMVPLPIMRVVLLDFNADRGRAYYTGTYNPAAASAPTCWSADGKAPDASVKEKQGAICQTCPMAAKGSKIQDGKEMVACSQHRMLAVVPAFDISADPLRLKIAVTSDYDKELVEHGWFALRQYVDFLKSRGVNHTGLVVTKIKFDANTAYPKLLFSLDRILSPDEAVQMKKAIANPKVAELLAEKWTAAGTNGTPVDDSDIAPQPALQATTPAAQQVIEAVATPAATPVATVVAATVATSGLAAAVADGWVPHPGAPGYHYKGQDVKADTEVAALYPAPAPAPVVEAAPPPPPVVEAAPPPVTDPMAAAIADGWVPHPSAPGYHYKGQDVVADGDLAARYSGSSVAAAPAPAAEAPTAAAPASDTGEALDPAVAALLNKWT